MMPFESIIITLGVTLLVALGLRRLSRWPPPMADADGGFDKFSSLGGHERWLFPLQASSRQPPDALVEDVREGGRPQARMLQAATGLAMAMVPMGGATQMVTRLLRGGQTLGMALAAQTGGSRAPAVLLSAAKTTGPAAAALAGRRALGTMFGKVLAMSASTAAATAMARTRGVKAIAALPTRQAVRHLPRLMALMPWLRVPPLSIAGSAVGMALGAAASFL